MIRPLFQHIFTIIFRLTVQPERLLARWAGGWSAGRAGATPRRGRANATRPAGASEVTWREYCARRTARE